MAEEKSGYDAGFIDGYDKGFRAGFEAARLHQPKPIPDYPGDISYPPLYPSDPLSAKGFTCRKCGMFFEYNKAYGYVCPDLYCPTQPKPICSTLTTNHTTNTVAFQCSSTNTVSFRIKDPGE